MALAGVLALQGDFAAHALALAAAGLEVREVRRPEHLAGLDGIALPGGESTTMLELLAWGGLERPLREFCRQRPTLATCAGLILLAAEVRAPSQRSLGILDVTVQRNGYGRQIRSGTVPLQSQHTDVPADATGVFIRAPRVTRVGPRVEVLATRAGEPVLLRDRGVLAACFHPELADAHFVTRLFAASVRAARQLRQ
jgi:5'-phosphate synthase pdxT subunit